MYAGHPEGRPAQSHIIFSSQLTEAGTSASVLYNLLGK